MTAYAVQFREIVVPRLARLCVIQAGRVAFGEQPFSDAVDAVMEEARRLGALDLPPKIFRDLEDWVQRKVLAEVDSQERDREELRQRIADDPIGHYSLLAFEFPALKWTFAAISPEYRRHCLEETRRCQISSTNRKRSSDYRPTSRQETPAT